MIYEWDWFNNNYLLAFIPYYIYYLLSNLKIIDVKKLIKKID